MVTSVVKHSWTENFKVLIDFGNLIIVVLVQTSIISKKDPQNQNKYE